MKTKKKEKTQVKQLKFNFQGFITIPKIRQNEKKQK